MGLYLPAHKLNWLGARVLITNSMPHTRNWALCTLFCALPMDTVLQPLEPLQRNCSRSTLTSIQTARTEYFVADEDLDVHAAESLKCTRDLFSFIGSNSLTWHFHGFSDVQHCLPSRVFKHRMYSVLSIPQNFQFTKWPSNSNQDKNRISRGLPSDLINTTRTEHRSTASLWGLV